MVPALKGFHGLEHVMEPVATVRGVRFVNDSKATNVEAARRSIESFDGPVVAIVGGQFKGGDLRELRDAAGGAWRSRSSRSARPRRWCMRRSTTWSRCGTRSSMPEAVRTGYALARRYGVVVLAPACASFDWFRDYAERGRVFKEACVRWRRVGAR